MEITAVIDRENDGRKIKYFVRGTLGLSYHMFSMIKTTDGMLVNGVPVHANHILREGDTVTVRVPELEPRKDVPPEDIPVNVIYEDDDFMIIDKDAPLACQCSEKNSCGTLENRLAARYPGSVFRPLNRLDRGTSGLMAAAKNPHACQLLQKQLHTDDFIREYLAVTEGVLEGSGIIDLPISKAPEASVRRIIDHENGQRAVTHYSAVSSNGTRTIVRLRLETGRTHQIRVHLSSIGHPIVGDFLYGTEIPELPGRFALHSTYIRFRHPISGSFIEFESPLPEELRSLCNQK